MGLFLSIELATCWALLSGNSCLSPLDFLLLCLNNYFFFLRVYLFLERGKGKEKERERNINVWLPLTCSPLGTWPATQACALDWESNQRPFGSQVRAQSTELCQPGLIITSPSISFCSFWKPYYLDRGQPGLIFFSFFFFHLYICSSFWTILNVSIEVFFFFCYRVFISQSCF